MNLDTNRLQLLSVLSEILTFYRNIIECKVKMTTSEALSDFTKKMETNCGSIQTKINMNIWIKSGLTYLKDILDKNGTINEKQHI